MNHDTHNSNTFLSIVIPLYNEDANIEALLNTLLKDIAELNVTHEIILVDDGSSDNTWNIIKQSSAKHAHVTGARLARNFGHQHALLAGLSIAKGQAIISMDGDLQHPPSLIQKMLKKRQEGYSVVNTCRTYPESTSAFKRKTSTLFYKVFSFLTDVPMSSGASDFRLLDRDVLNQLLQFKDVDLFLRGAVEWLGFHAVTIDYTAGERHAGTSKYTLSKMINFATGSIISFSTKPLVIGVWIGIITSILSFAEIIYVFYKWLNDDTVAGWASSIAITSFLFGILFIILGIIGTYLSRIHTAMQNRPRFIIAETVTEQGEQ